MDPIVVRSAVPTFLVADVAATVKWYVDELGFSTAGLFPEEPPHAYASLMLGQAEIMLLSCDGYVKPQLPKPRPTGHWDAYLRMDGVAALFEQWQGKAFIRVALKHQPYGDWEFEVQDPNGHVLVFGGGR
jgi:catechol 2,3-dioxygenase-like lactoylglutathione lyase family enzyme